MGQRAEVRQRPLGPSAFFPDPLSQSTGESGQEEAWEVGGGQAGSGHGPSQDLGLYPRF